MPYPRWLARINRALFNPRQVKTGKYPVVTHVGRSSGTVYRTPLDAHPTQGGYVLVVRYGPESDWVRNILFSGSATLRIGEAEYRLTAPRLVSPAEATGQLAPGSDPGADFYKAEDYLLMDHAS